MWIFFWHRCRAGASSEEKSEVETRVGWSHLYQLSPKKKRKLRRYQTFLDPIASSLFPLLPAPRWLALPLCLYHCWDALEGLSSLCSAFHTTQPIRSLCSRHQRFTPRDTYCCPTQTLPVRIRACASTEEQVHEWEAQQELWKEPFPFSLKVRHWREECLQDELKRILWLQNQKEESLQPFGMFSTICPKDATVQPV